MKYIKDRNKYTLINEKVNFSDNLYNFLYDLKPLIDSEYWDKINTFINTRGNNVEGNKKLKSDVDLDLFDSSNMIDVKTNRIWSPSKLLTTILPSVKGSEIQKLIYTFNGLLKSKMDNNFTIVSGSDIVQYFDERNFIDGKGELNDSCMNGRDVSFYVENDDVVSLLVLFSKEDDSKIVGRSLLWQTNIGTVMDRVYTINNSYISLFNIYSNSNGWYRRGLFDKKDRSIIDHKGNKQKDVYTNKLSTIPTKEDFIPFLDTFPYFIWEENSLYNSQLEDLEDKDVTIFKCQDTVGNIELIKYSESYIREFFIDLSDNYSIDDIYSYMTAYKESSGIGVRFFYDLFINKKDYIDINYDGNGIITDSDDDDLFGSLSLSTFNPEPKEYKNVSEMIDDVESEDTFEEFKRSSLLSFDNAVEYTVNYKLFDRILMIFK